MDLSTTFLKKNKINIINLIWVQNVYNYQKIQKIIDCLEIPLFIKYSQIVHCIFYCFKIKVVV